MRVAVTGAGGLLGTTLVPLWRGAGAEVVAWTRGDVDVSDRMAVRRAVREARPDVVVHAAAWTNVDAAEAEPAAALRVNRDGTAAVAEACGEIGATVVYISSDYVFDGAARAPIAPDAAIRPVGAYARSKAAGEVVLRAAPHPALIVRTAWVYGPGGKNFVDTMRRAASERRQVSVVDDQIGAPTSSRLLAEALWALVRSEARGTWHVAAAGATSWHGVGRAVFAAQGAPEILVRPCSSADLARPAPRPAYSVLDCSATAQRLGVALPAWETQVTAYARTGALPEWLALRPV